MLPDIFPECQIKDWKTSIIKAKDTHVKAVSYILGEMKSKETDSIAVAKLREFMGYSKDETSNFRTVYLENDDFIALCQSKELLIEQRPNSRWYIEKHPFSQIEP